MKPSIRLAVLATMLAATLGLSSTALAGPPFHSEGNANGKTCAEAKDAATAEAFLIGLDYLGRQYGINARLAKEALRPKAKQFATDVAISSKSETGGTCAMTVRVRFDRDQVLTAVSGLVDDKLAQQGEITVGVMMRFTRGRDVTQASFIESDQPIAAAGERLAARKIRLINLPRFVEESARTFQGTAQSTGTRSGSELTSEFLKNFTDEFRLAKRKNPKLADVKILVLGTVDVTDEGADPAEGGYIASAKALVSAENIETGEQLPTGPYAKRVRASTREDAIHRAMLAAVEDNIERLIQSVAASGRSLGNGALTLSFGPYSNYLRQGRPAANALMQALQLADQKENADSRGLYSLTWVVKESTPPNQLLEKVITVLEKVDGVKDALKDVRQEGDIVRVIVEFKQ